MITNIIYVIIAIILIFVLYLAVKAITRGVEAKSDLNYDSKVIEEDENGNIYDEIIKLKKLHSEGSIDDEEFKKAKKKLLD